MEPIITHKLPTGTIMFIYLKPNKNLLRCEVPSGFELLGNSTDLTEEHLKEIMPTTLMHQKHGVKTYKYRSYENGFMGFPTALEAYNSLKISFGLDLSKHFQVLFKKD